MTEDQVMALQLIHVDKGNYSDEFHLTDHNGQPMKTVKDKWAHVKHQTTTNQKELMTNRNKIVDSFAVYRIGLKRIFTAKYTRQ